MGLLLVDPTTLAHLIKDLLIGSDLLLNGLIQDRTVEALDVTIKVTLVHWQLFRCRLLLLIWIVTDSISRCGTSVIVIIITVEVADTRDVRTV